MNDKRQAERQPGTLGNWEGVASVDRVDRDGSSVHEHKPAGIKPTDMERGLRKDNAGEAPRGGEDALSGEESGVHELINISDNGCTEEDRHWRISRLGGNRLGAIEEKAYRTYLARIDQCQNNEGMAHRILRRVEFNKLEVKEQLDIFQTLGVQARTVDKARHTVMCNIKYDKGNTLAELVLLEEDKERSLEELSKKYRKLQRELRGRYYRSNAKYRDELAVEILRSKNEIDEVTQSLIQVGKRRKARERILLSQREVQVQCQILNEATPAEPVKERRPKRTRHVPRIRLTNNTEQAAAESDTKEPSLLELLAQQKRKMRLLLPRGKSVTTSGSIGGTLADEDVHGSYIKVCTFNVAGLDRQKLATILQFMESEGIDIIACIDARLSVKQGRIFGTMAKRTLGAGSVTHCAPCLQHYGGRANTPYRKVGGIFIIIGPKWGITQTGYIQDKLGPDEGCAGLLAQTTLRTSEGMVHVTASYWPIKHAEDEFSDQNLWSTVSRYAAKHKTGMTATATIGTMIRRWMQTANKKGPTVQIVVGDFNASWTAQEAGGQFALRQWAEEFSLANGPLSVARKIGVTFSSRGGDDVPESWIDHILHKGSPKSVRCVSAYCSDATAWAGISDHRPLWATYKVAAPSDKAPRRRATVPHRFDLDMSDKRMCKAFARGMSKIQEKLRPPPSDDIEGRLHYLTRIDRASGKLVKRLHKSYGLAKERSSHKGGWSPEFIRHKAQLEFMIEVRRRVAGYHGLKKWTRNIDMWRDLGCIIKPWEWANSTTTNEVGLGGAAKGIEWWKSIQALPTIEFCNDEIRKVKGMLHGRLRSDMRMQMNKATRLRETLRQEGKWKSVIKSLLGQHAGRKHNGGTDLAIVRREDGSCTNSIEQGHQEITEGFHDWFKMPEGRNGIHKTDEWKRVAQDRDYFMELTDETGVPIEYRDIIHDSIKNMPGQEEARSLIAEIFSSVPTYPEWMETIKRAKNNSSGGMSGVSYNQLKHWPEPLTLDVYEVLASSWLHKVIPAHWKWRWLVPIPKKTADIPALADLRPLILVEAVRKTWSMLILHKLRVAWRRHPLLNDAQHGYRAHRSTATASLLHINLLEDAQERDRMLHTSSYDLSKAFDTPSGNVLKIAAYREGCPEDMTVWMTELDLRGVTVVRTPHATEQWGRDTYAAVKLPAAATGARFPDHPIEGLLDAFTAERGTGQGDILSPFLWTSIMDILLVALQRDCEARRTTRLARSGNNLSYPAHETAYADDMHAGCDTEDDLQRKACIVSAFCIIMGLEISVGKLRRFIWAASATDAKSMEIYGYGWKPHTVMVKQTGCLTYLGGLYDLDYKYSTALQEMKTIAAQHCEEIAMTNASVMTKIYCANMTTISKVRYKAKFAAHTLAELREVDKVFYRFHRRSTKNMNGFPYDLLYLPTKMCGVGLLRLSDLVQLDKLAMIFTGLQAEGNLRAASEGLLQRANRLTYASVNSGKQVIFGIRKGKKYWLRSVLEWLQEAGIYLCRGGEREETIDINTTLSHAAGGISSQECRLLRKRKALHVGDLVAITNGIRTWSIPRELEWIRSRLPELPPTLGQPILWPGGYWGSEGANELHEVLDVVDEDNISTIKWNKVGSRYKMAEKERISMARLFQEGRTVRADLHRDGKVTARADNVRYTETPTIADRQQAVTPAWVLNVKTWIAELREGFRPRIFTDGAFDTKRGGVETVFGRCEVKASAGIIVMHDGEDWKEYTAYAMHIANGQECEARSALTMEFLALTMALRLQENGIGNLPTCTDAEAVVKIIRDRRWHLRQANCHHRTLLQSIDTSMALRAPEPQWVRGHPERRKPNRKHWTIEEWGNYMADRAAAEDWKALGEITQITQARVAATTAMRDSAREAAYYWSDASGMPKCINGLMEEIYEQRHKRYTRTRDQKTGNYCWQDGTYGLASEIFNSTDKNPATAGQTSRIIYNKHWNGYNRAKSLKNEGRDEETEACHMCGQPEDSEHWLLNCRHTEVAGLRLETLDSLEDDGATKMATKQQARLCTLLCTGIRQLAESTGSCLRAWTTNWDKPMMETLAHIMGHPRLSKKEAKELTMTLKRIGQKMANGAREILHLRNLHRQPRATNGQRPRRKLLTLDLWLRTGKLQDCPTTALNKINTKETETKSTVSARTSIDLGRKRKRDTRKADTQSPTIAAAARRVLIPKPLSTVEYNTTTTALQGRGEADIIAQLGGYQITVGAARVTLTREAISDEIVNGYLLLLRDAGDVLPIDTYFFEYLYNPNGSRNGARCQYDYTAGSSFTRRVNIFEYGLVAMPIYTGDGSNGHWTLILIDTTQKTVKHYDSAGGNSREFAEVILRYVGDEWSRHYGQESIGWTAHPSDRTTVPQQGNTQDCAIYTVLLAHSVMSGYKTDEVRIDGSNGRKHVVLSILNGRARALGDEPARVSTDNPTDDISNGDDRTELTINKGRKNTESTGPTVTPLKYGKEANGARLEIKTWRNTKGLYAKTRFAKGDHIGKLIQYSGTEESPESAEHTHSINGQEYNAWDAETQQPTCLADYANDPLQSATANAYWLTRTNSCGRTTPWLRAQRDIIAGEQIFVSYGARWWCNDRYAPDLIDEVIATYKTELLQIPTAWEAQPIFAKHMEACTRKSEAGIAKRKRSVDKGDDREAVRRSCRVNQTKVFMGTPVTDRCLNERDLILTPTSSIGIVLVTKRRFAAHEVVCTYNGNRQGRTTKAPPASTSKSEYCLVVKGTAGYTRVDAHCPITGYVSVGGRANDAVNPWGYQNLWNANFDVDDNQDDVIVIKATREILPGEMVLPWYGPAYWCTDKYPISLLVQAIKCYGINIDIPTRNAGDWTKLKGYRIIRAALLAEQWQAPTKPLEAPKVFDRMRHRPMVIVQGEVALGTAGWLDCEAIVEKENKERLSQVKRIDGMHEDPGRVSGDG